MEAKWREKTVKRFLMRPWSQLNYLGRLLLICCIINVWVSLVYALNNNSFWILSLMIGMFCGLSTYNSRYDKK